MGGNRQVSAEEKRVAVKAGAPFKKIREQLSISEASLRPFLSPDKNPSLPVSKQSLLDYDGNGTNYCSRKVLDVMSAFFYTKMGKK